MNAATTALQTSSYNAYAQTVSAGGNLSIPVKPSQFIYSQFNYVRGVSAQDNTATVSVTRIKILDTLIGQLVKMKQTPTPAPTEEARQDSRRTDALIEQYKHQLDSATAAAADIPYAAQTMAAAAPQPGMLFTLSV